MHDMEYHISYIIIKINYCKQFCFKAQCKMLETTIDRNNGANYMHNRKKSLLSFCESFFSINFYDLFLLKLPQGHKLHLHITMCHNYILIFR